MSFAWRGMYSSTLPLPIDDTIAPGAQCTLPLTTHTLTIVIARRLRMGTQRYGLSCYRDDVQYVGCVDSCKICSADNGVIVRLLKDSQLSALYLSDSVQRATSTTRGSISRRRFRV